MIEINLSKSLAFTYTPNKHTENVIMNTLSLPIASKKIKYLGIKLTKEAKDLYNENFKSLRRLRKILKNAKTFHVHGLVELVL